jgi:hypothetical protein
MKIKDCRGTGFVEHAQLTPVDELVATAVLPEPVVAVVASEELVGLVEYVIGLGAVILAVDVGAVLDTSFAQVEDPITV